MADAKEKCSLRHLLERHLEKNNIFCMLEAYDEVTKNFILDDIIKEMDKMEMFREYLQQIEELTNVRSKYLHIQICVRQITEMIRHGAFVVDKVDKVDVINKDAVQKSLKRAGEAMIDDLPDNKLAKS